MSYEPLCHNLAAEFLLDEKWANIHTINRLAQEIQDYIEQFIEDEREDADEAAKDAAADAKLQEWKDGERAIGGRYRGQK